MFLKKFKDNLKIRAARKFIKRELESPSNTPKGRVGITTIGCIVNLDEFKDVESFNEFAEEFSLPPNSVKVIGYKAVGDNNSPFGTPTFSDEDLGFKAKIENSYALEFLEGEYDVLVNYYTREQLPLQLMSVKTKARLKVGFGGVNEKINDLILNTPINDFQTFKKEMRKYLGVLNEI